MTTHVVINGKEVTNPVAKGMLAFGTILIAALVTALVIFVLLPIIGVAVSITVGFILTCIIAAIMGFVVLIFGAAIFGWLFGPTEFRIVKTRTRK